MEEMRAGELRNIVRVDLIINEDFMLLDMEETKLSVPQMWFELYRRLLTKQTGHDTSAALKNLDFRMN